MLEVVSVDHIQFLWNFSQEQCVDILFDYVCICYGFKYKVLSYFVLQLLGRKTAIATIPFTS